MKRASSNTPKENTAAKARAQRNVVVLNRSGRRTQHESDFTDRVNERWLVGQVDLAPQSSNVHINDVGAWVEVIVPNLLEEHRPSHHLAVMSHQVLEELEFARLQVEPAAPAADLARKEIDLEVTDTHHGGAWLGRAAQQCIDACAKLHEGKGFDEVVVPAPPQAADSVLDFPQCAQEQHWRCHAVVAQPLNDR